MSFAIDLSEHGAELKKVYESVISSDPSTNWAVFGYEPNSNALIPDDSGAGGLDDFVDAFDDARIQYGIASVDFNSLTKVVLVGWVGENVPSRQRLTFNAHMSAVAKGFPGHHIQITARSSDELSPKIILERVNAAAGSKYSDAAKPAPSTKPKYVQAQTGADEDDWGKAERVEERDLESGNGSSYKSNASRELEEFRKGKKQPPKKSAPAAAASDEDEEEEEEKSKKSNGGISGLDSGTSYKPVGKIDLKAIREAGKGSKFADARIEKIEPAYKPVGKVDLKAIREQARKDKELKSKREASAPAPAKRESPEPLRPTRAKREEPEDLEEEEEEEAPRPKQVERSSSSKRDIPRQDRNDSDDDDEPKFSSLADRMKAFQDSVSGAKPKFDASSRARSSSGARTTPSRPAAKSPVAEDDEDDEDDKEGRDDAPLSVAAQLAKARLASSQKEKEDETPARMPPRSTPKAPQPLKVESEDEEETAAPRQPARKVPEPSDEEEEDAPAPRRAPAKTDESDAGLTGIVEFEHEKEDDDEISLKVGDKITEIQKVDENWYLGKNPAGDVGLFPAEFVKLSGGDKGSTASGSAATPATPASSANDTAADSKAKVAIALYSYEAGDDDELSFEEDEEILEIEFPAEDWWSGKNAKGEFGLFPASYVKLQ